MTACRWRGAAWALALTVGALGAPCGSLAAQERERGSDLLTRVRRAYEDFSLDSARVLALRLQSPDVDATPEERAQAAFYLAGTYLLQSPPNRVDARRATQTAIRASVFERPDTLVFNADVLLEYERARAGLFAIGVRALPGDTVLSLEGASVGIEVGGTRPATVNVLMESVSGRQYQVAANQRVVGVGRVSLLFAFGGAFLPTGSYVLKLEATDDSAGSRTLITIPVGIDADTVVQTPLPDVLPDSAFRPERRPWGPARRALLGGLFVGALTAGVPQLLTPPTLKDVVGSDARAVGVGAFVAVSGLIGLIASKPGSAIQENVDYNENRRQQWAAERERIIADNERRRGEARIRLQFGRPSQ